MRTNPVLEIFSGFWSLLEGMRITIGQFFRPTVTVHYPHERLTMPSRFRGHIELLKDPKSGLSLCTSCKLCEKACPSFCIKVEGAKNEEAKRRVATMYELDFTKCSLCGACVEVCPVDAIRFSRNYNLAGVSRTAYVMDLFATMKDGPPQPEPAPKPAAPAAAPAPAPTPAPTPTPAKPESGITP